MTNIDGSIIQIIEHARKLLLLDNTGVWLKNDINPLFDVAMGSLDSTEVCELVGLYLLNKISLLIDSHNAGLYRDDWQAVIPNTNANGAKLQSFAKDIGKIAQVKKKL